MTITASLVNGVCYNDVQSAIDAYFSAQPSALLPGNNSILNLYQNVSGVWKMTQYQIDKFGVSTLQYSTNAVVPVFADCDATESFFDGMAIGWGVVSAMVAALSIMFIKKSFFR